MPEDEEILAYLGIDYADDMIQRNIDRIKQTARSILRGAVGNKTDFEDARAKEAMLIIIEDLYTNRGMHDSITGNTRRLLNDIFIQLRLEECNENI